MENKEETKDLVAQVDNLSIETEFVLVSILVLLRAFGFCMATKLLAQEYVMKYGPRNDMLTLANGNLDIPDEVMALFYTIRR